jgi:hypothetical protein
MKAPGQIGQEPGAVQGAAAQDGACLVHVQAEALGRLARGLLDDDPAVESALR